MIALLKSLRDFELQATSKWFLLAAIVGVVAGMAAIVFHILIQLIQFYVLQTFSGFSPAAAVGEHVLFPRNTGPFSPWMIVVVMAAGGLVSGLIVYSLAPAAAGPGTDAAIDAFHNHRGQIGGRIPVVKTLASAITLGTGGSAGREGPIAQIGAGCGSYLAARLNLSDRDRRILMAAGMGAGIGAIFRAPLAGAMFAGEIFYRDADLEADVIVPSAVSSAVAYCVYSFSVPSSMQFVPLFGANLHFQLGSWLEMLPYTLLGLLLVFAGTLYIKSLNFTQLLFQKLPGPPHVRPMIGAILAGTVGVTTYYACGSDAEFLAVLGSGYGTLQKTLSPEHFGTVKLFVVVALVKVVTTSLTISSGGSGGVFGPSMVIGGCIGGAVGAVFHTNWPELVTQPQAFIVVGMAGFFAGCARAPFSTILMVAEITGEYRLLLPAMWVCTLCFIMGSRWTLYGKQVSTRLESPAHRGDFLVDVLEGLNVSHVYRQDQGMIKIPETTSLDDIVHMLAKTTQRYFPVTDSDGQMVGIFSAEDVRRYTFDDTIWQLANANDVMNSRVISVTPEDDLNTTLTRFTALNVDELPVVSPGNPGQLVGMVRRKELIAAYNQRLIELKHEAQ